MTDRYAAERIAFLAAWRDRVQTSRDAVALYDELHALHLAMRDGLERRNAKEREA